MSNRPPISWSAALRELKGDRATRAPVREERLRTAQGLRGAPALALSAWRGRSSKRYVVSVQSISDMGPADLVGSVALFVIRDASGVSTLLSGSRDITEEAAAALLARAKADGAREVHLHRISGLWEHAQVLADLELEVA